MNNLRTRNLTNLPFSSYKSPVLLSPHFSPHQNTLFLSFLRGPLSCFLLSVSRIGTCRIHACLINSAFNLTDERDSAARESQTWKKEIQKWKTKSEEYEREKQVLQERLERAMEQLSSDLEIANKEPQEQIRQLQRMNEELQDKVTNEREQHRGE